MTDVYDVVPVSSHYRDGVLAQQRGERSGGEAERLLKVQGADAGWFQGRPGAGRGQARQRVRSSHHTIPTPAMCHATHITKQIPLVKERLL